MKILGIDPGTRIAGWAVIQMQGNREDYIASGTIELGKFDEVSKLGELFKSVQELIQTYTTEHLAIERSFLAKNVQSTMKLAEARAAAMVAAHINGLEVFEYSPKEIKLMSVGTGNANKDAVKESVKRHFKLDIDLKTDTSDALAIALTHAIKIRNPLFLASGKHKSNLTRRKTSWRNFTPPRQKQ